MNLDLTIYIDVPSKSFSVQPLPLNLRDYVDITAYAITDSIVSANTAMYITYEGDAMVTAGVIFENNTAVFPLNMNTEELFTFFEDKSVSYSDNFEILILDSDNDNIILNSLIPVKNSADPGDPPPSGYVANEDLGNLTEDTSSVLTIVGGGNATIGDVTIQVKVANISQSGYLTTADWVLFTAANTHSLVVSGNPHSVTAGDLSLGNVDNTSDLNKPISTDTQTALDLKQDSSSALELGETDTTAYRGDRGKIAYDHSQVTGSNPHATITTDIAEGTNLYYTEARVTSNVSVAANAAHVALVSGNPHSVTATEVGLGNVTNESKATMFTSPVFTVSANLDYSTASELLATDGSKNVISLAVATYPSLTELAYVKGVTSSIQTQLDGKEGSLGFTAENIANKVTTITVSSTDVQYASAKCLYDNLQLKADSSLIPDMLNNGLISPDTTTTIVWTPTALLPGTVTIAPTGSEFKFNIAGTQYSKTVLQSVTLPNTSGLHCCYFDNTGTLVTSMTFGDLQVTSPVRAVYWNATTKLGFEIFESHTTKYSALHHMEHHLTEGTQYEDGLIPIGYTFNSASDAAIIHTAPSGHIWDEDLRSAITAQLINDYTLFYRTGLEVNNEWSWDIGSTLPVKHTVGVADYNKNTTGTWGQEPLSTLKYINFFGTAIPAINADFQKILIQGTIQHDSQVDAEGSNYIAEIPGWANVLTEFRPITQFTYRYKSGDGGTANVRLVSVQNIAKSNVKITSSATTNTDVNALHVNVPGEINALTEKSFIHDDDTIIIEDNENGGIKKHIKGSVINSMTGTGWIIPPELSINVDTTKFDKTVGFGVIFNYDSGAPTRTFVTSPAVTAQSITYLLTKPSSNVSIDSTGTLIQTDTLPTDIESREKLYIGALLHVNQTILDSVQNEPVVLYDNAQTMRDFMKVLGYVVNDNGNVFTYNGANLTINKSAGDFFRLYGNFSTNSKSPHFVPSVYKAIVPFLREYYNGTNWVYDTVTTTTIPVTQYNNIATGLVAVSNNKFLILPIYIYPGTDRVIVGYGQVEYDSLDDAKAGLDDSILEDENIHSASLRCKLIVETNATDLSDATQASFIEMDRFGSYRTVTSGGTTPTPDLEFVDGDLDGSGILTISGLKTVVSVVKNTGEATAFLPTYGATNTTVDLSVLQPLTGTWKIKFA